MKIVEDISYSIDDIISQIKENFGFIYTPIDDYRGYIVLGNQVKLRIEFNEEERKLDLARIQFPEDFIDIEKSTISADIYSSGIESAIQIVDLIKMMLGGNESENS